MYVVALFTRAWIEIKYFLYLPYIGFVALFTRAWIEIIAEEKESVKAGVALFTRAWIEMMSYGCFQSSPSCRPLYEGVD